MIGSLLGLVSSIVGGALSSASHDETQSKLSEMVSNTRVPESVRRGEAILRENVNTGLPGYQEQLSEIDSSIPMTLNQAKDYISGGGLVDALSKMYSQGNAAKRQIGRENDAAILANKNRLAQYLGSVSAGYENETQRRRDALQLMGLEEGKSKTFDILSSAEKGINSLISGIGGEQGLMDIILGYNQKYKADEAALLAAPKTPKEATFDDYIPSSLFQNILNILNSSKTVA